MCNKKSLRCEKTMRQVCVTCSGWRDTSLFTVFFTAEPVVVALATAINKLFTRAISLVVEPSREMSSALSCLLWLVAHVWWSHDIVT